MVGQQTLLQLTKQLICQVGGQEVIDGSIKMVQQILQLCSLVHLVVRVD